MKRILVFCSAFALLCSMFAATASAAGTPSLSLSDASGKAGDSLELTLSLSGFDGVEDPGGEGEIDDLLGAVQAKIYFDADVFSVQSYGAADEAAGKASPCLLGGEWGTDVIPKSDDKGSYIYVSLLCLAGDGASLTDDAGLVRIPLRIQAGAPAGDYTLDLEAASVVTGIEGTPKEVSGQFGLQVMCIGHGMATATIIERL